MELRQFRYFVTVVDSRSITRAAHHLHVVQSALSHQIANLEKELGTILLLRGKHGVVPTEAGLLMYQYAQTVLKNVEAAKQAISTAGQELRGSVQVAIPNSTAGVLALPLLQATRKTLPHVQLSLIEGLSTSHAEGLAAGKFDLAILFDVGSTGGFDATALCTERLHFLSADPRAVRAYTGAPAISLEEVGKWPLLLPPLSTGIRLLLDRACARTNLSLQIVAELSGLPTIRGAVQAGLGSTIIMAVNAQATPQKKQVVMLPIKRPGLERRSSVVHLRHASLTPAAAAVKALILETTDELIKANRWPGAKSSVA